MKGEILPKGFVRRFEPTAKGREAAERFHKQFPTVTRPVFRVPHHVELLADFELRPVDPVPPPFTIRFLSHE